MNEPVELIDVWRGTLEATVRFYSTIGELAVNYLQSLVTSATTVEPTRTSKADAGASANQPVIRPGPLTKSPHPISTMVLEADGGARAIGVFLVENLLARPVTATPAASELMGEDGRKVKASLIFQPPSITLAPGEHATHLQRWRLLAPSFAAQDWAAIGLQAGCVPTAPAPDFQYAP